MCGRAEQECADRCVVLLAARRAPAGEHLGKRGDVGLGVAAVHADRVQLHDFACVVLVESARLPYAGARIRADRAGVVEVGEHRRVARRGKHHVVEVPQHVRPDCLALEGADQRAFRLSGCRADGEMVGPERDEALDIADVGLCDAVQPRRELALIDGARRVDVGHGLLRVGHVRLVGCGHFPRFPPRHLQFAKRGQGLFGRGKVGISSRAQRRASARQ